MEQGIEIKQLNHENIFQNFSAFLKAKKFITVSGPNNCGKTTLIRILNREIITEEDIKINQRKINDYTIEEYSKLIQCVIPLEILFLEKTLEEELFLYNTSKEVETIVKELKLKKIWKKDINSLVEKEIVLSQIAIACVKKPKILLLDNISSYFDEKEIKEILIFLKKYQKKNETTIIYTTLDLEESLMTDCLYIISDGKIALEGIPYEVLQKDNVINKIGLNIPFMMDLSVKLKDYDLIEDIELEKDRMVEALWK